MTSCIDNNLYPLPSYVLAVAVVRPRIGYREHPARITTRKNLRPQLPCSCQPQELEPEPAPTDLTKQIPARAWAMGALRTRNVSGRKSPITDTLADADSETARRQHAVALHAVALPSRFSTTSNVSARTAACVTCHARASAIASGSVYNSDFYALSRRAVSMRSWELGFSHCHVDMEGYGALGERTATTRSDTSVCLRDSGERNDNACAQRKLASQNDVDKDGNDQGTRCADTVAFELYGSFVGGRECRHCPVHHLADAGGLRRWQLTVKIIGHPSRDVVGDWHMLEGQLQRAPMQYAMAEEHTAVWNVRVGFDEARPVYAYGQAGRPRSCI
ncbi:hypothetical protein BD626DRAFT_539733 [Schizophyllum amplum]|uniref:Uncharacterized protein n=1 Tax=Schizophyllum amplum TaxID=97359 RepID=A0A550C2A8_9AGAR|nr:hypothetical protein BD626DRAFT_539733 [Auriculariopsis ampla]